MLLKRYTAYLTIVTFGTVTIFGYMCLVHRTHDVLLLDKTLRSWEYLNFSQIPTELSGAVNASNVTLANSSSESSKTVKPPASEKIKVDSESPGTSKAADSSKSLGTTVKSEPTSSSESSTTAATSQPAARTVKLKISDTEVTRVVHKTKEPHGHIFVYSSFEEQTNGARNLWQLEMWAKLLDMKVAVPFAVNSMFGISGAAPNFDQALRFSDYYDIEEWNKSVRKYGGSPLVQWEEFLCTAPLNAVILYTIMRPSDRPPYVVTYDNIDDVKKYDPGKYEQITDGDMHWIEENFNIIRVVTLIRNDKAKHPLALNDFNSYVFGNLKPNNVTLIVVNWIGIGVQTSRIEIKGGAPASFLSATRISFITTSRGAHMSPVVAPSTRIMEAYKAYKAEFIGDRKYIGVLFRTQLVMFFGSGSTDFGKQSKFLLGCSKTVRHELDKLRNKWGMFLAYDLGQFGSVGFFDTFHDQRLFPLREQIFLDVFNGTVLPDQRDSMLIKAASGVTDTGFIALLEKTIAVHADCVILLGKFSSFIRSAASMYLSLHDVNRCIVSICSEKFRDSKRKIVSTSTIPGKFLHA